MAPSPLPLSVTGLDFSVGRESLLTGLTFALESEGCTAVIGPNGSGKTLLLRLCHGMLMPSAGEIRWGDISPARARHAQAMVFQSPVMLNRSVRANISYALKLHRVSRIERGRLVDEAIAQCGLADVAERNARVLSGGEKQKLAIARAWVTRPRALLMDEPTSELDPLATREIEAMIRLIVAQGVRVVLATHDMGQVCHLAGDVLFLEHGKLAAHLPVAEFRDYRGSHVTIRDFATRLNLEGVT